MPSAHGAAVCRIVETVAAQNMNMSNNDHSQQSGIRDNHFRGKLGDYLKTHIKPGSQLSVVSAYFTIYAYQALKENFDAVGNMRFLFGDPGFLASIDPDATNQKAFRIEDDELDLSNRLSQKAIARECAAWMSEKTEIRSVRRQNLLHGKLYHIENGPVADAIVGSSNLTLRGMGLAHASNIELNLEVDSARDRRDLKGACKRARNRSRSDVANRTPSAASTESAFPLAARLGHPTRGRRRNQIGSRIRYRAPKSPKVKFALMELF